MKLSLEQVSEYYKREDHPMHSVVMGIQDTYLEPQEIPGMVETPPLGYRIEHDDIDDSYTVIAWYPRFSNPRTVLFHYEAIYTTASADDALIASWNIYESVAAVGLAAIKEAIHME